MYDELFAQRLAKQKSLQAEQNKIAGNHSAKTEE
jgi:hypothetical protein